VIRKVIKKQKKSRTISFVLLKDPVVKQPGENITAIPVAVFLM
jgi:hypothetical protein